MAWHQILASLYPSASFAFDAACPFRTLADQINFAVPLAVPNANRTHFIKVASALLNWNAVQRVRVLRPLTRYDALFMCQKTALFRCCY